MALVEQKLTCGFRVRDFKGNSYTFGGTATGRLMRLEHTRTWDTVSDITHILEKNIMCVVSQPSERMFLSEIRHVKMLLRQSGLVTPLIPTGTYYPNQANTGLPIPFISGVPKEYTNYYTWSVVASMDYGDFSTHKISITWTSNEAYYLVLIFLGIFWKRTRGDLI